MSTTRSETMYQGYVQVETLEIVTNLFATSELAQLALDNLLKLHPQCPSGVDTRYSVQCTDDEYIRASREGLVSLKRL